MKPAIHQRDVDTAAGMLMAYDGYKGSDMTSIEVIAKAFDKEPEDLYFLWDSVADRSSGLLEAVKEVESMLDMDEHSLTDKMFAIKQSAVMTAICEMLLIMNGDEGFSALSIPDLQETVDHGDTMEVVRTITGGLEPAMLAMVSHHVVTGSYPKENATQDIITALWIEGYVVTLLGPVVFEEMKDKPFMKRFLAKAAERFIILP
jgi:hypothetical protein